MTKRLSTMLLFLVGILTGTWAQTLVQDADGYYQIGTAADWEAFATLVVTNPTANAKMTADIDLGESQAMLGDSEHEDHPTYSYQGTFDGQGHTLTVHYTGTSQTAPFAMLQAATIRNIHVDGTINNTSGSQPSVIARVISGTTTVENVWSSVITTDTRTGWDEAAAIVGCVDGYKSGHIVMRDCLFTGTVNSSGSYNGCFVGFINSGGSATVSSCLSLGTFNYTGGGYDIARGTYTNCFVKQFPGTIPANMQATDEKLASGEIAYKLQARRGKMFWGQTIGVDPVPVMTSDESKRVYRTVDGFSNTPDEGELQCDAEGYYLLSNVNDWKRFAMLIDDGFANVNAKMTADIDLGDDQTMIGSYAETSASYKPFSGIFDAQGHTLTVNYDKTGLPYSQSSTTGAAPFRWIQNATIRNLHVAGTITTSTKFVGGIVLDVSGTNNLIERCRSSVNIISTVNGEGCMGGLISHMTNNCSVSVRDCVFDGSMNAPNAWGNGGIMGYKNGTGTFENCLSAPSELSSGSNASFCIVRQGNGTLTVSNCHYKTALGTIQGNQATADELANGKVAFYLQNGRADLFWGQKIGTDPLPVLTSDESKRVYRSATGYTNDPTQAIADQDIIPLTYTRDADNNLTITGFDPGFTPPANYQLVIPDDIDGSPVVGIAVNAFDNRTTIASVSLPANLTTLGEHAFRNCTGLTEVTIPATVTTMGKEAFMKSGVKTVVVSCKNLAQGTFHQCADLESVTINEGVETLGIGAFHACPKLPSVTIPSTVTFMDYNVFRECPLLSAITFADGIQLTTIPNTAFYSSGLTSITIPESVTTIGQEAFRSCTKLTTVNIPTGTKLTTINTSAFADCLLLHSFDMPNTLTTMGNTVFYNCQKLETVSFSNQMTAIPDGTFQKCSLLDGVTIPHNITRLGNSAFLECTTLSSIVIPNTITAMGTNVFNGCTGLTAASYEDGFTMNYIPDYTFYNTRFSSFTFPASVQTINLGAFMNNTALAAIEFPATVTTIGESSFKGCSALTSVNIPATVITMGKEAFMKSGAKTAVVSCKNLAQGTFHQCADLESVTINEGVETLGIGAFHACPKLPSVTIPRTVTFMDYNVFRECPLLTTVTFEDGIQIEAIPNTAFYQCTSLTGITIPASVNTIGNSAFRYCEKLNDVTLPGSLISVQDWAFANCTAMENLTIEEGVSNISRDVFQYSAMKNVVLPSTLDFIGVNLFYSCNQLEVLDLSKCVNVWELYSYTSLRGGSYNITYGVPATTKIIMPPYAQATLGANDEVKDIEFNLTKDADDFYLINNADDWDKFVAYSRANPTVNGRITANLDLTDHVGKLGVGNGESNYITWQGTLDGQGHTLTISYKNGKEFTGALIAYTENATVKNLHVKGSVDAYYRVVGGIVGFVKPSTTLTIQDCESSVNFTVTPSTTNMHIAGFIGQGKTGDIYLTDCLYNGTITGVSSFRYAAGFMGWIENGGHTTYNYCLNNGSFANMDMNYAYVLGASQSKGMTTAAVCYGNIDGGAKISPENLYTPVSTDQLKTGMVAYRLQGGRDDQHWGQKLGTDLAPRLTTEDGTRVYRGQTYTNTPTEYTGLKKDDDEYYLISGTADWEEFCTLVQEFPLSNARMTADVEVADHSMIGTSAMAYSGTFDGQGHTLTVNYAATENYCAPFNFINGATIKNLHTAGQISIGYRFGGGIVASSKGTNTMQHCWSSVNILSSLNGDATHGGLVAYQENGTLTITNCLFDGSIVGEQSNRCGGFIGYRNGTLTIENSLCVPTAITINEYDCGTLVRNGGGTISNCYFTQSLNDRDQGVKVTTEQLASGYVAFKLQGKSDDLVWAQAIGTDEQPQLVVFNPTAQRVYRTLDGFSNNPDQAALKQDAEGYYLIGTVDDWKTLALLVDEGESDVKARMTADIDLGDDQTMIGSGPADADLDGSTQIKFQGIFDGQGHTLTINYVATEQITGPFRFIQEATIKNLRVTGTISTGYIHAGGIVGICFGQQKHSYIENCISSVNIISSRVNTDGFYGGSMHGGIIGKLQYYGQLHIDDCIFNGSISGETRDVVWGGFVGLPDGTVTISNSLQVGTFDCEGIIGGSNGSGTFSSVFGNGYASKVNVGSNNYYLNQLGNAQGTKATAETLADGTVTTALQAGRDEELWVQYGALPMLKLFAADYILGDANGDSKVDINDALCIVNYLTGNAPANFNAVAADVNVDGVVDIADAVAMLNIIMNQ